MTTTTLNLTRLSAGDTLQEGDYISTNKGPKEGCHGNVVFDRISHTPIWSEPSPIQPHTIGRVILGSDLINARYFRS